MGNKKAWVAVTEAVFGIVILFTFVMITLGNQQKQQSSDFDFNALFIQEIENNQSLRDNILDEKNLDVGNYLQNFLSKVNNNYNLEICIADMNEICKMGSEVKDKEIIAMDYFVVASPTSKDSKKLRIFVWRKD